MTPRPTASTRAQALLHVTVGLALLVALASCSHVGRLTPLSQTIAPVDTTGGQNPQAAVRHTAAAPYHPMYGADTLVGFVPGTGDSARRYLGRLRSGYTADTLNLILLGDNRPGFRTTRINGDIAIIKEGISPNPVKIARGLIHVPIALVKGMVPDAGLVRDVPYLFTNNPKWDARSEAGLEVGSLLRSCCAARDRSGRSRLGVCGGTGIRA